MIVTGKPESSVAVAVKLATEPQVLVEAARLILAGTVNTGGVLSIPTTTITV